MTRLLCCLRARADMGAAISHPQESEACDGGVLASPPTMADVIRERKKKSGGAGLGTLRRRIAAAARRPRDSRPDRGCEHARFIRSVVGSWRLSDVFQLCAELEAGAALRDLATQAELAREPAPALHADLAAVRAERWWCDVEVVGAGFSIPAHKVILASRCTYFRDLLQRYPRSWRVPLEGAGASLSREEVEAAILALYAGAAPSAHPCEHCRKWDRGLNSEADLDIISVENSTNRRCTCTTNTQGGGTRNRRLGALLGFSIGGGALARDLRRVLESGELADARLAWPEGSTGTGGTGGSYGFRGSAELPCHRLLLAARSRFFRNVLSRRCTSTSGAGGVGGVAGVGGASGATIVCVDEKVLPRRFARALLHAAYTDQVDLSLIGRISSSPSSTNSSSGTLRGNGRGSAIAMLDDAFQLYEIARFLEMPIVAQGCEDAAARALCADTLPHALRWAAAPHASAWLHRQAMRYLRDEFPTVMASPSAARLPRASLASALASPFLQASEAQALRALLRWAERAVQPTPASSSPAIAPEPNLLWHTTHARRAARARRRAAPDAALRDALADLLPLLRLEHLPADCDARALAARRGLLPPPAAPAAPAAPDAWLGRAGCRPVRCFLPYLDELRALLQDQAPTTTNRRPPPSSTGDTGGIPDTLYMVAAAAAAATAWGNACVPPRVLRALRARAAELRAAPAAQRALLLHAGDVRPVRRQIALRAVREMSLPDACAELLLNDTDIVDTHDAHVNHHGGQHRESSEEWERGNTSASRSDLDDDCCRSGSGSGSIRGASGGVSLVSAHASLESRSGACRRELPTRPLDGHSSRNGTYNRARLSAAVPDVAMAPNANTHLLTARDYPHPLAHTHTHGSGTHGHGHAVHHGVGLQHPHVLHSVHSELGGVLQLDLGDGATHTPRPGSRAQRAARQHREHSQGISCPRRDDDELRAAIELSVIRAYSSLQVARRAPHIADLLPPPDFAAIRNRATPSPSSLSASSSRRRDTPNSHAHTHTNPRPHVQLSTTSNASGSSSSTSNVATGSIPSGSVGLGVVGGVGSVGGPAVVGGSRSPSPRRSPYPLYALYANRDLGRSSRSRGPSPHAHAYA